MPRQHLCMSVCVSVAHMSHLVYFFSIFLFHFCCWGQIEHRTCSCLSNKVVSSRQKIESVPLCYYSVLHSIHSIRCASLWLVIWRLPRLTKMNICFIFIIQFFAAFNSLHCTTKIANAYYPFVTAFTTFHQPYVGI